MLRIVLWIDHLAFLQRSIVRLLLGSLPCIDKCRLCEIVQSCRMAFLVNVVALALFNRLWAASIAAVDATLLPRASHLDIYYYYTWTTNIPAIKAKFIFYRQM